MGNALKVVAPYAVQDTFGDIYTAGVGVTFTVGIIHIANVDTSEHTVEMCIDDGGGDVATNALLWDVVIPPNEFIEFGRGLLLAATYALSVKGDTDDDLVVMVSGIETS